MTEEQPDLPKTLWIMWAQGSDEMPYLVRRCIESWHQHNPGWRITLMTLTNLAEWVDPALLGRRSGQWTIQQLSDLSRLDALARHGGVWTDATTLCMRPLDEWLPGVVTSGFFAFAEPGADRMLSSWFLASQAEGYLIGALYRELRRYHDKRRLGENWWNRELVARIGRHLNVDPYRTAVWFTPPLRSLGVVPYFSFHYLFGKLAVTDRRFANTWATTPKVSADGPHTIQRHGYANEPTPEILEQIYRRAVPLYKLDWRVDPSMLPSNSVLRFVLDRT